MWAVDKSECRLLITPDKAKSWLISYSTIIIVAIINVKKCELKLNKHHILILNTNRISGLLKIKCYPRCPFHIYTINKNNLPSL